MAVLDRLCTSCHINAVDQWKLTALDYALQRKNMAVAELMIKNGAHVDHVRLLQTRRYRLERDEQRFSGAVMEGSDAETLDRKDMDLALTCLELSGKHQKILAGFREREAPTKRKRGVALLLGPGKLLTALLLDHCFQLTGQSTITQGTPHAAGPRALELNAKTMARIEETLHTGCSSVASLVADCSLPAIRAAAAELLDHEHQQAQVSPSENRTSSPGVMSLPPTRANGLKDRQVSRAHFQGGMEASAAAVLLQCAFGARNGPTKVPSIL